MQNQFHFKNMEPDPTLRFSAHAALDRILARSPYGARAVAILEKEEAGFRCAVDIYSKQGPFVASTVRQSASEAVRAIEAKLTKQLESWRERRDFPLAARA